MDTQQQECSSGQINSNRSVTSQDSSMADQFRNDQHTAAFQNWVNQVRQQAQRNLEFEEWANQVRAQMLRSLRKHVASS